MSSELKQIETKRIGFAFKISVEKETRIETGAKYPDKKIVKAELEGNADTYENAVNLLKKAKTAVLVATENNT